MRPEDVLYWVKAVPFVPFRIQLVGGRTFDIRHPEMVRVGRTSAILFQYGGDTDGPYEKVDMIGLLLIESIAPINSPQAA